MYLKENNADPANYLYPNGTPVDWGNCVPGDIIYFENMTVINTGGTTFTINLVIRNLPTTWSLTWENNDIDCSGRSLEPGAKVEGELTLTIPVTAATWPEDCGFWLKAEA